MKKILFIVLLLSGCAHHATNIAPITAVDIFADHDCPKLELICSETADQVKAYAKLQNARRSNNSFKIAMNVLVLPIFWWGLGDNEDTAKLAEYMGKYQECQNQAARKGCSFRTPLLNSLLE